MTNIKSTKRALLTSAMALFLCFAMLLGTTYAWFTDSVTSNNNIITSGNLDVELYHTDDHAKRAKVGDTTLLFDDIALWEPGAVVYETFEVANEGTLALKYQLSLNISNATDNGKGGTLADVLKIGVIDGGLKEDEDRDSLLKRVQTWSEFKSFTKSGNLDIVNKKSDTYTVVIYWEPSAIDNDYNMNNGKGDPLTVKIGVTLFATQYTFEEDSFNNQYDVDTYMFNVKDANERLAAGKDVTLINCIEPDGIIYVPVGYTGKLVLQNVTIASVQEGAAPATTMTLSATESTAEPKATNIVIAGNVVIRATENGMSAITGTALNISGNGHLTAIAKGDHAYGIGGDQTTSITITGITIDYIEGGHAYEKGTDLKYYKNAPEGGAAIGSGKNGAVITLNGVTVTKAIGGSKSAGIGARFWTGVTVNIIDSNIGYVEGGVTAAGIGGGRVSKIMNDDKTIANTNGKDESVNITITDSIIKAQGGIYGAGIGSGYDVHCPTYDIVKDYYPVCTINIGGESVINATGGDYAAGVGTGYHNAGLAGSIENTVILNAASGKKYYKDTYTTAMDVGFGVVDPKREASGENKSVFTYNGMEIKIPSVHSAVDNDSFEDALRSDQENILVNLKGDVTYDVGAWESNAMGGATTKTITINGNGYTITFNQTDSDWNNIATDAKLIINNAKITNSGYNNGPWNRHDINFACEVELNNVISDKALAFKAGATLKNVTINDANTSDTYAIWIQPKGQTVNIDGLTVDMLACSDGRGIKIDNQYLDAADEKIVTLNIKNATFKTEEKSAILVNSNVGANITLTNVDISGVKVDTINAVWVDEAVKSAYDLVTVEGGTKIYEGDYVADGLTMDADGNYYITGTVGMFNFAKQVNEGGKNFSGKTVYLTGDVDLENRTWEPIGQTGATEFRGVFDGQGYTIKNLFIDKTAFTDEHTSSGLFGWAESGVTIKNVKIDGATVKGNHNVAAIVGYTYSAKVSNCHVTNATIICTHANGDACGDKAGVIAGYAGDESRFTDCSASNSTVTAGRDAGQVIGTGYNVSVSNCTATNVTVTATGDCNRESNINNAIIGRVMG